MQFRLTHSLNSLYVRLCMFVCSSACCCDDLVTCRCRNRNKVVPRLGLKIAGLGSSTSVTQCRVMDKWIVLVLICFIMIGVDYIYSKIDVEVTS